MEASIGSGPVNKSESVFLTPAYSYLIWFLIGCLAHFGLQLFVLSCSIFTDVLEIPSAYCGSFLANMVAFSIVSCYLGFICSHLLFPLNKITIEFSFIVACISLVLLCLVNIIDKKIGRVLYVITTFSGCFCFGVMETVGISSANDPGLQGKPPKRVVFFLCGHPIGYVLVLLVHLLIENSYFSFYINSCGYIGSFYSCYGILVLVILGVPVILFIINYLYPIDQRRYGWQNSNVVNSFIYYTEAIKLLKGYVHYIVILMVIEATEIVLNWRIILFLHDPYPKFDSIICSISIVIGYAIFDFVGRGFSIGIRRMVSDLKDRRKIMLRISKEGENAKENRSLDEMESAAQDQDEQDPEVRNRVRIGLFRSFLPFTWLPISFRIITGVLIFFQRHFPKNLALENYTNLHGTVMLTMINAFIRGIVVSYVYSNLFEASKTAYLEEHHVAVYPKKGEAQGCIDARYNASITGALVVSVVRLIDLSLLMVLAYIFYKYNRLLFDVSDIYRDRNVWATDHLSSDFCKFFWWVKSVCYLIWRDLRSPFEIF